MDAHKVDVAGSLFTSLHRHVKIEGRQLPKQDMEGTGSVSAASSVRCVLLRRCRAVCAATEVMLRCMGPNTASKCMYACPLPHEHRMARSLRGSSPCGTSRRTTALLAPHTFVRSSACCQLNHILHAFSIVL